MSRQKLSKIGDCQYRENLVAWYNLSFAIFCEHSLKSLLICCDAPQHYILYMDVQFFFSVACYSLIGQSLKSRRLVFNRLVQCIRLWKLPMYLTPIPTICLKLEVGVNVGFWDGQEGSFVESCADVLGSLVSQ